LPSVDVHDVAAEAAPDETEKQRGERLHHLAMLSALEDDRVTDMDSLRAAVRAHKLRAEEDELRAKGLEAPKDAEVSEDVVEGVQASEEETLPDSPVEPSTPTFKDPPSNTPIKAKQGQQPQQQRQNQGAVPRRWAIDDGKEYPILTERAAAVARWVLEAPPVGADGAGRKKKKKTGAKAGGTTAGPDAEMEAEAEV
jgi:lipoprotein-anchoring transpeptidase ErfK/SrfK